MEECHYNKYQCLVTHQCENKYHNLNDGILQICGKMNPFIVWEKHVNEKKHQNDLNLFMDHYDIPTFIAPQSATEGINAFF